MTILGSHKGFRKTQLKESSGSLKPLVELFIIILLVIFAVDTMEYIYVPIAFPFLRNIPTFYYDPLLTTIFVAPVLWVVLLRPISRYAVQVKTRYDAIRNQVVDAIITIDAAGIIVSVNTAAMKLFCCDTIDVIGLSASTLLFNNILSVDNLNAIAESNSSSDKNIHELSGSLNGNELRVEITVSRLYLDGEMQFVVILRDITGRYNLDKKTKEMQTRLIQINKMTSLGLMVSGVAHEINNPNNYILSNAQLLERSCDDMLKHLCDCCVDQPDIYIAGMPFAEIEKCIPEMVSGIIEGSQRINDIIHELKEFSRTGTVSDFEEVDVNSSVVAALAIVKNQMERHTHKLGVFLGEDNPPVSGNSHHLSQVVINLLMNSCQALRNTSEAVNVRTFYDFKCKEVVISVADEGSGISEEISDRVKEPFFTTKNCNGGTGLGLSISDAIVREHNGILIFMPNQGSGTIFEVRLPAIQL